jgi:tRNA modification GTPase
LLTTLAHIEAYIDFPDEAISPDTGKMLSNRLEEITGSLTKLVATAGQGRILRHGLRTVIYGEPNVGKSSLLNLLLGCDRAIVSETPGTTRDTIEETINIRGIPVRLIDTAGQRSSEDATEREGIRRTELQLGQADLVLQVVDASAPGGNERERARSSDNERGHLMPSAGRENRILVLNKVDLGVHADWELSPGVRFSCQTREGLAKNELPELISIELRDALDAVGDVIGRHDTEDLLGRIFSEFCIGK